MQPDVIVVGGGPAGSAASTMLARQGWRVLLLEKERFPREHIGESLLPASLPILEELGVLPAIEAEGFLKKWGATMVWGSGSDPWSWHFRETNRTNPHAYQVLRPRFDQLLLENARAHGVDVREGFRVVGVDLRGQGRMGVRAAAGGEEHELTARFVVDASGQAGLIGRSLGLRHADDQFRNLAAYAYFEGAGRLPAPDENNIFIESYEHGWFWNIPLHNGWMSVGAVVDHARGSAGIREHGLEDFLRTQIASAPHTAEMLSEATMASGPFTIRDWSYDSTQVTGDGWVLAGDAACFIDPLFSTGVHLALSAGVMAAAYVTTALKDPELAAEAAPVYRELYHSQYDLFRQLARLFYSTNRSVDSYFWEARRIMGDDPALSPRSAFIRAVAGQPPKGYERMVMARGDAPAGLVEGVEELTAGRAARRATFDAAIDAPGSNGSLAFDATPRVARGTVAERKPVLAAGEFARGHVLVSEARPEGTVVSPFVAGLLTLCDGARDVSGVIDAAAAASGTPRPRLTWPVLQALGILYADGAIELDGLG